MTPARFRWGVLLITIGLLFLLRNVGVFNDDFWIELLIYFPLVIIAIGVEKIFTRTKLQAISYGTSVFLLVGGLGIAFYYSGDGARASFFSEMDYTVDDDPSARFINAEVDLGNTDLTIRDSGRDLLFAEFDRFTRKPRVKHETRGDTAYIECGSRVTDHLGGIIEIDSDDPQDWYMRFSESVPLGLRCKGEEADIHMNLSTTPLRSLDLDTRDATVYLKLGEMEPFVKVVIRGEDSRVRLRVPEKMGLRVRGEEFDALLMSMGLTRDGLDFVTEGYDSLVTKLDLELDDRLSSFSIDFF